MNDQLTDAQFDFDFQSWEAEIQHIDIEQQAKLAFDGLLVYENESEDKRTLEDIKHDVITLMSNPEIIRMQQVFDYAAMQFAQFCNHNHLGADQMGEGLRGLYDTGQEKLESGAHNNYDHDHSDFGHEDEDDDDEKSKKRKKRKS